jgi:hypothetical protein
MKHNVAKLQHRWAVRWALVWVAMWLVVVIAGCRPQNGSEDGASAGKLDDGEGGHGARLDAGVAVAAEEEGGTDHLWPMAVLELRKSVGSRE